MENNEKKKMGKGDEQRKQKNRKQKIEKGKIKMIKKTTQKKKN